MAINTKLPSKVVNMAEALANKTRRHIFELLLDSPSLSFNQIMKIMNIDRAALAYHLKILKKAELINNFYDKRQNIKDHSYYEISEFGKRISEVLLEKVDKTMKLEQYNTISFRNVSKVNIISDLPQKVKPEDDKKNENPAEIVFIQNDGTFKKSEWKTQSLNYQDYKKLYASKFKMENDG
jgi:predicted transcriptional regulator